MIDISNEEYHRMEALGSTSIKTLLRNAREFKYKKFNTGKAMAIGTLTHLFVLEPEKAHEFLILDRISEKIKKLVNEEVKVKLIDDSFLTEKGNRKTSKEIKEKIKGIETKEGVVLVTENELFLYNKYSKNEILDAVSFAKATEMKEKAENYKYKDVKIKDWIKSSTVFCEKSFFGKINGVKVKCRPDILIELSNKRVVIIDLKTTAYDASAKEFKKSVSKWDHNIQEAHYRMVLEQNGYTVIDFLFLTVSSLKWSGAEIYRLPTDLVDAGKRYVMLAIEKYKYCKVTNTWREGIYTSDGFEEVSDIDVGVYMYDKFD